MRAGKLKIFATSLYIGELCILNCAWDVYSWLLDIDFFFFLFFLNCLRCDPDTLSFSSNIYFLYFITGLSDPPLFTWQHQGLTPLWLWYPIRRFVTHYSILHKSANSILYVHVFRYYKSSTGHTFHILLFWLISLRFMCNLGLGVSFSWSPQ